MIRDRFGYWAEGQAYQTPRPVAASPPICPACGSRHRGATVNCERTNDQIEEDHDATD